jgi:hypothetical protein
MKSKADFYYKSNWTVEGLYKEKPAQLLKAYYTLEKISFNEEVLEILKSRFPNFIEIQKPGKLEGDWKVLIFGEDKFTFFTNKTEKDLLNLLTFYRMNNRAVPEGIHNAYIKAKAINQSTSDNIGIGMSKRSLQAMNQSKAPRKI